MTELKKGSPFAINFRKLQQYNFSFFNPNEIILFEYLMLLAQSFGYKQFYHSTAKISQETGIKRNVIEATIIRFEDIGILEMEVKGFPKIKHFFVKVDAIIEILPTILQFAENNKLYVENYKLYVEIYKQFAEINSQENINTRINNKKNKEKETKENEKKGIERALAKKFNFKMAEAIGYVDELEKKYNSRRRTKADKNGKNYPPVTLGHKNATTFGKVLEAMNTLGTEVIENAWLVYNDQLIKGELNVVKILPFFFSKNEGEYDVIGNMVDKHNLEYVYS